MSRMILPSAIAALCAGPLVVAQQHESTPRRLPREDMPRVAIIQYESGRILIARQINGELQVIEPADADPATLSRYLMTGATPPHTRAPSARNDDVYFIPQPYLDHQLINTNEPGDAPTERVKQNAAELSQQVKVRRQRQGISGTTTSAGQVYPLTAGQQEHADRLTGVQHTAGNSPYVTFYSLGSGLEYYRQRELAARRELALLTYEALFTEGLRFFHEGRYGQAARSFVAATEKDQGDAGSRLHAAQALMASGLYAQAIVHIRRAFELQPQLASRPLDHLANYSEPGDYGKHLQALQRYVAAHPREEDALILLAYEQFFGPQPHSALEPMRQVKKLARSDSLARRLCQAAEPVLGPLD